MLFCSLTSIFVETGNLPHRELMFGHCRSYEWNQNYRQTQISMVIAAQESTRGQHGIQQTLNLQKVLDLLVFQISLLLQHFQRGNNFVSVLLFFFLLKHCRIRSVCDNNLTLQNVATWNWFQFSTETDQILDFFEIFSDLQYSGINTVVRFLTVRYYSIVWAVIYFLVKFLLGSYCPVRS